MPAIFQHEAPHIGRPHMFLQPWNPHQTGFAEHSLDSIPLAYWKSVSPCGATGERALGGLRERAPHTSPSPSTTPCPPLHRRGTTNPPAFARCCPEMTCSTPPQSAQMAPLCKEGRLTRITIHQNARDLLPSGELSSY